MWNESLQGSTACSFLNFKQSWHIFDACLRSLLGEESSTTVEESWYSSAEDSKLVFLKYVVDALQVGVAKKSCFTVDFI